MKDLTPSQAMHAARRMREARFHPSASTPVDERSSIPVSDPSPAPLAPTEEKSNSSMYAALTGLLGGRLSYLAQAAGQADALGHARAMLRTERAWLQSVIGLIPDHDDDVMDEVRLFMHLMAECF